MNRKPDGESAEPPREKPNSCEGSEEYPTPTPFDPKASASAIISEARSIQELLKTYEQNTKQLREDVQEFVVREIAEESKFRTLSVAVAQEELVSLQNIEYIKFSHANSADCVQAEAIMPTSRMGAKAPNSVAADDSHPSSRVTWAKVAHPWAPDNAVPLSAYGDAREVLLGWRSRNTTSDHCFSNLCGDAFSSEEARLCCFFNGVLYSPFPLGMSELINVGKSTLRSYFWDTIGAATATITPQSAVNAAARAYATFVAAASSQTPEQLKAHLWLQADHTPTNETNEAMNNYKPQIMGDSQDCLVVVSPARLRGTQTFRGFFMRKTLVAVEHMGPQVDVLPMMCSHLDTEVHSAGSDLGHSFADREKQRIIATFRDLFAAFCEREPGCEKNIVMTVAISPEPLSEEQRCTDQTLPHTTGVVLCIRAMAPSLPFFWYFTWADICSLGQMLAAADARGSSAEGRQDSKVAFKCTRLSVSALSPMDVLSTTYFPTLNEQILLAMAGTPPSTADAATPVSSAAEPLTAKASQHPLVPQEGPNRAVLRAAGLVAVMSAATAAAALALRRK